MLFFGDTVQSNLESLILTIVNFLIFSIDIIIEFKILKYVSPYELNTLKGVVGKLWLLLLVFFYKGKICTIYIIWEYKSNFIDSICYF